MFVECGFGKYFRNALSVIAKFIPVLNFRQVIYFSAPQIERAKSMNGKKHRGYFHVVHGKMQSSLPTVV